MVTQTREAHIDPSLPQPVEVSIMVDVEECVGCRGLDLEVDDPVTCAIDKKPISEIEECPIERWKKL